MTRRRRSAAPRLAAVLLVALGACVVPSLEALEQERPRTCDDAHPCLDGYDCVDGVCTKESPCTPTQTRACGESLGECESGTETCSDTGTWGPCLGGVGPVAEACDGKDNDCDGTTDEDPLAPSCGVDAGVCADRTKACVGATLEPVCTAASFGPDYEATESRCDGLDNDCDGRVDDGVPPQPCPRDAGVCAGATGPCNGSASGQCYDSTYAAHSAFYEAFELTCDGRDNDCDGLTDTWVPRPVTGVGTTNLRRKVAAVVVPHSGSAVRRDVLILYEYSNRVLARVLKADGTMSQPLYPSMTMPLNQKAPALGTNGVDIAEAWLEELSGQVYRLPVALAGPLGEALVNGDAGVYPVSALPGPGLEVVVGMTAERIVLAYAHRDSPVVSTSTVVVASCPRTIDTACTTRSLGAGRNPSLLVSGDAALVAYETDARPKLAKLSVPPAGAVTELSNLAFGSTGEHDSALAGTFAALELYSVLPGPPEVVRRRAGDCSGACDPTILSSGTLTQTDSAVALSAARADGVTVLAWEDGQDGGRVVRMMVDTGTPTFSLVSPVGETGRRPVPVLPGTSGFEVPYDTEGGSGVLADQVVSRWYCAP